jgi:UPF0042 nucleotide-binding protein
MIGSVQPCPTARQLRHRSPAATRAALRPGDGLSGAGRGTALPALEDMGYVAVDNVPLPLLGDLMRSTAGSPGEMAAPLAFGIDTRTYGFDPHDLVRRIQELRLARRHHGCACCSSIATARPCCGATPNRAGPHPLAPDRPVKDGIGEERKQLGWVRDSADVVSRHLGALANAFSSSCVGHFALATASTTRLAGDVVLLPPWPAARGRPGVRRAVPEKSPNTSRR